MKVPRSAIRWDKVSGPRAVVALLIGTALGAGLFPFAPGTMGTLVGLPLAYFTADSDPALRVLVWTALFAAGVWAARALDLLMGTKDNSSIVIDEVVGLGITAWTAGHHPTTLITAFVLFRIFDIVKPPPIRQLDTWSKKKASEKKGSKAASWWAGFGVMADDVLAGLMSLAIVIALQHFGVLP